MGGCIVELLLHCKYVWVENLVWQKGLQYVAEASESTSPSEPFDLAGGTDSPPMPAGGFHFEAKPGQQNCQQLLAVP
jgi:hypothetical protein